MGTMTFEHLSRRLDALELHQGGLDAKLDEILRRLAILEARVDRVQASADAAALMASDLGVKLDSLVSVVDRLLDTLLGDTARTT